MSTIIATTLSNGSVSVPTATVVNGSAKAWVNFNGSGTVAILDSFNVSSLTDNGAGNYTVTFSNAFDSANYAAGSTGITLSGTNLYIAGPSSDGPGSGSTTTTLKCYSFIQGSGLIDFSHICASAHGDLA